MSSTRSRDEVALAFAGGPATHAAAARGSMEPDLMKTPAREGHRHFQTTRWSVVRRASSGDDAEVRTALAQLCETYWHPLYAYFRRSGRGPHDAEDLTQSFFARLMEKETFAVAAPDRGRLRSFLLTCARHFLADDRDRALAQKRGALLLFDTGDAEERYAREPADDLSPDRLFQQRWALTILESSLGTLAAEFAAQGKAELFAGLRPFLGFGTEPEQRYEAVCAQLGLPLGTVKSHVFRLRQRWRELLFAQVAETLENPTPEAIRSELTELLGCV